MTAQSLLIEKDAYMFLKEYTLKSKGYEMDEKKRAFEEKNFEKRKFEHNGKIVAEIDDNYFCIGNGSQDCKTWKPLKIEQIKKILDNAGFKYEDGDGVEYIDIPVRF